MARRIAIGPNDFAERARRHLADAERTRRSLVGRWGSAWDALEQRLRANHHRGGRGRFNIQTEFDAVVDRHAANHFAAAIDAGQRSLPGVFPIFNDFAGGAPETSCAEFDTAVIAGDRPRAAKALFRVIKRVRDHQAHGFKVLTRRDRAVLTATLGPLIQLARAT